MSLDKTFRFDESVCGRCGRTAPAGCICVGTKALQPNRRVFGDFGYMDHDGQAVFSEAETAASQDEGSSHTNVRFPTYVGGDFPFWDTDSASFPDNELGYADDEKCFKSLSDLIGYNVKSELWRYSLSDSPSHPVRIDAYEDTQSRVETQERRRRQEAGLPEVEPTAPNPNKPRETLYRHAGGIWEGSDSTFSATDGSEDPMHGMIFYRDDTPQRLAEIAAEDDDEPEEFKYEKMLSYLNTGSGGALVPPPEFSLKAKKKKKTVQGEDKTYKPGDAVEGVFVNAGENPNGELRRFGSAVVRQEYTPENYPGYLPVTFADGGSGSIPLTMVRRRKNITPPRVKMGVMRATAPNRIDLVVEIIAKIFNEQAVQQFLQEMAGGIPPQQGKMFRKAYRRPQDNSPFSPETQRIITETLRPGEGARTEEQSYGTSHELDARLKRELEERITQRNQELKFLSILASFKRFRVPFVKNLRGHLVKAGFTGTMQDAMGRRMCFSAGKRVHCAKDERGTHDDKVQQEEAPVPGNLSSGEGTANPAMQGIDVLKEIKFRIQGIAAQCSLPPNAVRDVVLFLLEVPDEFLMAFNAELDMRGEEIRAILFEAVSALAPQPVDQVDNGRPVPPTLKMLIKNLGDLDDPANRERVRRLAVSLSLEEDELRMQISEALRNRSAASNIDGSGVPIKRRNLTNEAISDMRNLVRPAEPYDPVVRDDPPPEGQKSFPSPDLVLYEMQKNPNPTELERMQMELLMRILNDRNFA